MTLFSWSLSSCKENGQSHETKAENIERTADIPKDTLIKILMDIIDYVSSSNVSNSGLGNILEPWQKKYLIGYKKMPQDSLTNVKVDYIEDNLDSSRNGIILSAYVSDSLNWLSLNDLEKKFGMPEEGIVNYSLPVPKDLGHYYIFKVESIKENPIYLCVISYRGNVDMIQIKDHKNFYPLKNR
ncbi:MAG: hypothetical protein DI598_01095 [Pseudopedobacter saltans]|uniref:Uncharacterized protein n=1 Tax=Pseudopedobacter saltans TaxID=151895 RepID=A0A2W5H9V6_9SPHI|nr:MAG: hypothetical protein DI598_01095 [Pseudopedobacter saltans]